MKAPLTPENFEDTKDYVHNSIQYLKTLINAAGKKIIDGPSKNLLLALVHQHSELLLLQKG